MERVRYGKRAEQLDRRGGGIIWRQCQKRKARRLMRRLGKRYLDEAPTHYRYSLGTAERGASNRTAAPVRLGALAH
mgnify:CR=1 FL=1